MDSFSICGWENTTKFWQSPPPAPAAWQRERAVGLLRRCIEMGDAPARYTATVGSGTYLALTRLAELHRGAGELAEAIELLARCAREQFHR